MGHRVLVTLTAADIGPAEDVRDRHHGAALLLLLAFYRALLDALYHTFCNILLRYLAWLTLPWFAFHTRNTYVRIHRSLATLTCFAILALIVSVPTVTATRCIGARPTHDATTLVTSAVALASVAAPPAPAASTARLAAMAAPHTPPP